MSDPYLLPNKSLKDSEPPADQEERAHASSSVGCEATSPQTEAPAQTPLDHPLVQMMMSGFANYLNALPELDKQRLQYAHEEQMQRERLHYESTRRSTMVGLVVLLAALLVIVILAGGAMLLLERGMLNERTIAQAGILLGAVISSVAVTKRASQPPAPPPTQ